MISQRLKQLRLARGLSLEALAAEMGGVVTKQALSKYEKGRATPSPSVLNKLAAALHVKSVYLWNEPGVTVQFVAYRKGSGLGKREQEKVESFVRHELEERIRLQRLMRPFGDSELPVRELTVHSMEDVEGAANGLRQSWNIGLDPISSVTGVLEDHSVHVLEVEAGEKFDGLSAVVYEEQRALAAAVVTRRGVPGERQRLNMTHELGHLVLDIAADLDEEKAAFRFGAAFLAPADWVYREVGTKRSFIQPAELFLLKKRCGMSIQALLYRLHDLDIISNSHYKMWCIEINRLQWRKAEPDEWLPEKPQWLHRNVLRAVAEGLLTHGQAEAMLDQTLENDEPLSLIERRAFMKLPVEKRRSLMSEQAGKMVGHYSRSREREEFQGGDIIAY